MTRHERTRLLEPSKNEITAFIANHLQNAPDDAILNMNSVRESIMKSKKDKMLEQHKSPISYSKNQERWITYVVENGKRRQIVSKNKEDLLDKLLLFYGDKFKKKQPTLSETFQCYNTWRQENGAISASSAWRYQQQFQQFYGHSGFGQKRWDEVKSGDFIKFIDSCAAALKMDRKHLNTLKSITKGLITQAVIDGYIQREEWRFEDIFSYCRYVPVKKVIDKEQEHYSDVEVSKIVKYLCDDLDNISNLALLVMFSTGLRIGELVALQFGDINTENHSVRIERREQRITNKNGEDAYAVVQGAKTDAGNRLVPYADSTAWIFDRIMAIPHRDETDYIFTRDGMRIHHNVVRHRLRKVCGRIGVTYKPPHKVRKTVATAAFLAGVDEKTMKDSFGWTDIAVGFRHYDERVQDFSKCRESANNIQYFNLLKSNKSNQAM